MGDNGDSRGNAMVLITNFVIGDTFVDQADSYGDSFGEQADSYCDSFGDWADIVFEKIWTNLGENSLHWTILGVHLPIC